MVAERTSQDSGFTLLEVVVALAIAALAIVGLFQAASGGLLAVNTAGRVEEAVQRAQSHLAAVGRSAALIQGEFTDDDGGAITGGCAPGRWQPAKWRPRTGILPRRRRYSMSRSPFRGPGVVVNDRWC